MVKMGKVGFDKVGGLGGLRLPVTILSFTLTSLFTKYYNKNKKNIYVHLSYIIFILIITREQAISATSLLMATINC